jgi:hypothetical protein
MGKVKEFVVKRTFNKLDKNMKRKKVLIKCVTISIVF